MKGQAPDTKFEGGRISVSKPVVEKRRKLILEKWPHTTTSISQALEPQKALKSKGRSCLGRMYSIERKEKEYDMEEEQELKKR